MIRAVAPRAGEPYAGPMKVMAPWIVLLLSASVAGAAAREGCVRCHESERLPISLGHSFEEWKASIHGRAGVGCSKCHGGDAKAADAATAHRGVLPAADPASSVHAGRIADTCGACHKREREAYAGTVHARELREHGRGANCLTCHGAMATSLPTPSELDARCSVCHAKPMQAQAALAMLAAVKIQLHRTGTAMRAAKRSDPRWHADAQRRFHDIERDYGGIQLTWHTFRTATVLEESRDLLGLAKALGDEAVLKGKPHPR